MPWATSMRGVGLVGSVFCRAFCTSHHHFPPSFFPPPTPQPGPHLEAPKVIMTRMSTVILTGMGV